MQQEVTQLFTYLVLVVTNQCVAQLVGFFYRVGTKTLVGLLAVPWTLLAQTVHHVKKPSEGFHLFLSAMHGLVVIGYGFETELVFGQVSHIVGRISLAGIESSHLEVFLFSFLTLQCIDDDAYTVWVHAR